MRACGNCKRYRAPASAVGTQKAMLTHRPGAGQGVYVFYTGQGHGVKEGEGVAEEGGGEGGRDGGSPDALLRLDQPQRTYRGLFRFRCEVMIGILYLVIQDQTYLPTLSPSMAYAQCLRINVYGCGPLLGLRARAKMTIQLPCLNNAAAPHC